jgi:hypothetical protein
MRQTITESTLAVSSDLQELLTVVCHTRASMKRGVILVAYEGSWKVTKEKGSRHVFARDVIVKMYQHRHAKFAMLLAIACRILRSRHWSVWFDTGSCSN